MAYTQTGSNFGSLKSFGQLGERAGPNKRGGLPTKWDPDLVFNPDAPNVVFNVNFMIGKPAKLPAEYVTPSAIGQPAAVATWVWDPAKGPAPWPGLDPTQDPRNVVAAPAPSASIPTNTLPGTSLPAYNPAVDPSLAPYMQQPVADSSGSSGILFMLLLIAAIGGGLFLFLKKKKEVPVAAKKRKK